MPRGWLAAHSKVRLPLHDAALTTKRLKAVSRPRNSASSCCYLCALKGPARLHFEVLAHAVFQ